jgi:hypothetical protein
MRPSPKGVVASKPRAKEAESSFRVVCARSPRFKQSLLLRALGNAPMNLDREQTMPLLPRRDGTAGNASGDVAPGSFPEPSPDLTSAAGSTTSSFEEVALGVGDDEGWGREGEDMTVDTRGWSASSGSGDGEGSDGESSEEEASGDEEEEASGGGGGDEEEEEQEASGDEEGGAVITELRRHEHLLSRLFSRSAVLQMRVFELESLSRLNAMLWVAMLVLLALKEFG